MVLEVLGSHRIFSELADIGVSDTFQMGTFCDTGAFERVENQSVRRFNESVWLELRASTSLMHLN